MAQTNGKVTNHQLLLGLWGSCKTVLMERFKSWYEAGGKAQCVEQGWGGKLFLGKSEREELANTLKRVSAPRQCPASGFGPAGGGRQVFVVLFLNGRFVMTERHKRKYAGFLRLCQESKANEVKVVVVSHPKVLGDNYEELVTNLGLLAEHGLTLGIAGKEP